MNRKRSLVPDVYKQRKKICLSNTNNNEGESSEENLGGSVPSDTKAALLFLRSLFPVDKFEGRLPAIILKHQIYSLVKNKTDVDKQLGELRTKNEIRLFKLGTDPDDFTIVFSSDFHLHASKVCLEYGLPKPVFDKFSEFLSRCPDISLTKDTLRKENFSDDEIGDLMAVGLLTIREVGSWWVAIPNASQYVNNFIRGRKSILLMVRKTKYKEILQKELESRKLPKAAKLGMQYHIHDIIGAELVTCIDTICGRILKLKE